MRVPDTSTDPSARMVQTSRLRLFVRDEGPRDGHPVVLLHGWPQTGQAWRKVTDLLAADLRVVAPDLRGAGASEAPRSGYDTGAGVRDVLALLDELGLARVALVGQDHGGWLALQVALRHPDRVTCVVALGSAHPWMTLRSLAPHAWWYAHTVPFELPGLGRVTSRYLRWLTRAVLRRQGGTPPALSRCDLETYVHQCWDTARASEKLQWARGTEVWPILLGRYRTQRLQVPTVMLVGDLDPGLSFRVLRDASAYADDLSMTELTGARHLLAEERPQEVAEAVRSLVRRSLLSPRMSVASTTGDDDKP